MPSGIMASVSRARAAKRNGRDAGPCRSSLPTHARRSSAASQSNLTFHPSRIATKASQERAPMSRAVRREWCDVRAQDLAG